MHFGNVWPVVFQVVTLGLAGLIAQRIRSPKDHERAAALDAIAQGAAALVVSLNPKAEWAALLEATVTQVLSVAGLPTDSNPAVQRAASAALTRLGKNPGVPL